MRKLQCLLTGRIKTHPQVSIIFLKRIDHPKIRTVMFTHPQVVPKKYFEKCPFFLSLHTMKLNGVQCCFGPLWLSLNGQKKQLKHSSKYFFCVSQIFFFFVHFIIVSSAVLQEMPLSVQLFSVTTCKSLNMF